MRAGILVFTFLLAFVSFEARGGASSCVERLYSDRLELYREAYQQSRFLGWGLTNHYEYEPIRELSRFLDVVGAEENLRFIFVELPKFSEQVIKRMSLGQQPSFADAEKGFGTYFASFLSPHVWQTNMEASLIYNKVAKLNRNRKVKLIVVPIDSGVKENGSNRYHALSWDRELTTKNNFEEHVKKMAPSDKAILLYHVYHLTRKINGTTHSYAGAPIVEGIDLYGGGRWFRKVHGPVSFFGMANVEDNDYRLIVFEQLPMKGFPQLMDLKLTSALGSADVLARLSNAHPKSCLTKNNFFEYYARDLQYPKSLNESFHYYVKFKEKSAVGLE